MKRNLDLVRKILEGLEEMPEEKRIEELEVEGFSSYEIMFHFILMDDAGLIRCERVTSSTTPDRVINVHPFGLTWEGYEFLETSKNDKNWNKAKDIVNSKLGAMPFDIIKALLISLAKNSVGL